MVTGVQTCALPISTIFQHESVCINTEEDNSFSKLLQLSHVYHRDNVNAKNMINQTQSHVKTVILKLTMMFA